MRFYLALLTFALMTAPAVVCAAQTGPQPLFKIERSKNANIIQYDAQIGSDGKLLKKEPVIGYWIRLAEQGQVQQLSWVQRTFAFGFSAEYHRDSDTATIAFGFSAEYHRDSDTATIDMVADIGQPITVKRVEGKYMAVIDFEGQPSQLERIFIQAHGKGISVTVEYVEIFGVDLKSGEPTYGKIIP